MTRIPELVSTSQAVQTFDLDEECGFVSNSRTLVIEHIDDDGHRQTEVTSDRTCRTPTFGESMEVCDDRGRRPGVDRRSQDSAEHGHVHDQLPSVDDVKMGLHDRSVIADGDDGAHRASVTASVAYGVMDWTRRHRNCLLLVLGLALAILVPTSLLLAGAGGGSRKVAPEPESDVEQVVQFLTGRRVTPEPTLVFEKKSPQHHAVQFVAAGDSLGMFQSLKRATEEHRSNGDGRLEGDEGEAARVELMSQRFVERYILAVLFYALNGSHWTYGLNFLSGVDHCGWHTYFDTHGGDRVKEGVTCDEEGRVTKILLSWNNLEGTDIPNELSHLDRLESFHAYNNQGLSSVEFPRVFRGMTNLRSLALHHCQFGGTIPDWIGGLTKLTSLGLSDNNFRGTVASEFSRLTSLRLLGLDDNSQLHGNINDLLGGMRSMEFLYLQDNLFDGSIEDLLDEMPQLMEFDASNNLLDGTVPNNLLTHKTLMVADLHGNFFSGAFPNDFLSNKNLEYLSLYGNEIAGTLPDRIAFLEALKHIDVSSNRLTGVIPDTISQMTALLYWNSAVNPFDEQPIQDLSNLSNLQDLSFKSNNIVGTIPDWIGTLKGLRLLDLDANFLKGTIPHSIGDLRDLNFLLLNRNHLTGTLPVELASLDQLQILLIDANDLRADGNIICRAQKERVSKLYKFVADCYPGPNGEEPEVFCQCCTMCCLDGDESCNDQEWTTNQDPEWEYGYIRPVYHFSLENAPAVYSKKNFENAGSTDSHNSHLIDDLIP